MAQIAVLLQRLPVRPGARANERAEKRMRRNVCGQTDYPRLDI